MGLTPGVEVRLLRKCPFCGPVQIEVRGVELALGYGIASKVFVKLAKAELDG
jgi:ferrous iron transport protein A